jgi:hypothetical protein
VSFPAPSLPQTTVVKSHTLLPLRDAIKTAKDNHQSFRFCLFITLATLKYESLIYDGLVLQAAECEACEGKDNAEGEGSVNAQNMYSCNLLADAGQVDLRFNAYFSEYFWVTDSRNSSISVVKSISFAARRQGFNHPRIKITILLRTSCIFPSFIHSQPPT